MTTTANRLTPIRILFLLILASGNVSCLVGRVWVVDHHFKTEAARVESGREISLRTTAKDDETDLYASDKDVEFFFRVTNGRLSVTIRNKGQESLSLALDESSFVDATDQVHTLSIVGQTPGHQETPAIEPGSKLEISVWPSDWAWEYKGRVSTWRSDSLLIDDRRGDHRQRGTIYEGRARSDALANWIQDIGKSFEINLSLNRGESRMAYRFRFTVTGLFAKKIWWA